MKAIHDGEDHHDPTLQACKVVPSNRMPTMTSNAMQVRVSSKKVGGILNSTEIGSGSATADP
eukprot:scaffold2541_cov262-Pinguiococcus_pyrenoidosus.AAC.1